MRAPDSDSDAAAATTLLRLNRSRQRGGKRPKETTPSALGVAELGWKRGD
eukprot:SAG11_NODE_416_length_9669_cov_7.135528_11_plen_50_part_00